MVTPVLMITIDNVDDETTRRANGCNNNDDNSINSNRNSGSDVPVSYSIHNNCIDNEVSVDVGNHHSRSSSSITSLSSVTSPSSITSISSISSTSCVARPRNIEPTRRCDDKRSDHFSSSEMIGTATTTTTTSTTFFLDPDTMQRIPIQTPKNQNSLQYTAPNLILNDSITTCTQNRIEDIKYCNTRQEERFPDQYNNDPNFILNDAITTQNRIESIKYCNTRQEERFPDQYNTNMNRLLNHQSRSPSNNNNNNIYNSYNNNHCNYDYDYSNNLYDRYHHLCAVNEHKANLKRKARNDNSYNNNHCNYDNDYCNKNLHDRYHHLCTVNEHKAILKRKARKVMTDWNKMWQKMKVYREIYGHCNVIKRQDELLYNWVRYQRLYFSRRKRGLESPMTEERMKALKALDFDFVSPLSPYNKKGKNNEKEE